MPTAAYLPTVFQPLTNRVPCIYPQPYPVTAANPHRTISAMFWSRLMRSAKPEQVDKRDWLKHYSPDKRLYALLIDRLPAILAGVGGIGMSVALLIKFYR